MKRESGTPTFDNRCVTFIPISFLHDMETEPFIPLELVEIILTSSSKPTLLACSLVCRDWLPITRQLIFSFLKIYHDTGATRLRDILKSPQNTISSSLRGFDIHIHDSRFVNSMFDAMSLPPTRVTFGAIGPDLSLSPFLPRSLTVLSLNSIYEGRQEHIMPVICSLPSLEALCLENVHIDTPDGRAPTLPLSLHSLKLVSVIGFFRWFSKARHEKANLSSLGLVRIYNSSEPVDFINEVLALDYFSTVSCLTLNHPGEIDLSQLTGLRSIHCSCYVPSNSVDPLCRQLRTTQLNRIRNIHLYFKPLILRRKSTQKSYLKYELYEPIVDLLALPRFQSVQFVQLCLLGAPISQEHIIRLEGWLSDFGARGVLSFTSNQDESYDGDHMHYWPRMGIIN
ncbi:hypothetical protein C8J56DRAFT_134472 [Mycena floridula]|nr:hypothetical protein C8J56DRAFT_134472 [Mycena floridula]